MHTVSKKAKWQLSTDSWMNKMWSISESQKQYLKTKNEMQSQKVKSKRQKYSGLRENNRDSTEL